MWKLVLYILIVTWAVLSFPHSVKKYKKDKEIGDLLEVIARILLIPSGVILIIAWFLG